MWIETADYDSEELMQNGIFFTGDEFDIRSLVFSTLQNDLIFFYKAKYK